MHTSDAVQRWLRRTLKPTDMVLAKCLIFVDVLNVFPGIAALANTLQNDCIRVKLHNLIDIVKLICTWAVKAN